MNPTVNTMKTIAAIFLTVSVLFGCGTSPATSISAKGKGGSASHGMSTAITLNGYKQDIAQRISQVNASKVFPGQPQPLLRSVIVVKYSVDGNGNLVRSAILRSNHDRANEAMALATLRNTAPFPKPAQHLLHQGRVEILESWLFNDDGRFQLRTIAQPQADS